MKTDFQHVHLIVEELDSMNVIAGSSRHRGEAYLKLQQLLEEERSDHCEYPLQLCEALAVGSIVMRVS
jgi:hypothetical protein